MPAIEPSPASPPTLPPAPQTLDMDTPLEESSLPDFSAYKEFLTPPDEVVAPPPLPLPQEQHFSPHPELTSYALASLELTNLTKIAKTTENPAEVEQFKKDCMRRIEEQIAVHHGLVESVHQNILFLSMRREESTQSSATKLTQVLLEILAEPFTFQGVRLLLRAGMDLEDAHARNPIISTTERSIAMPGALVVSETLQELLEPAFALDPIGPLRVGNRMVTFYHVLRALETASPPPQEVETVSPPPSPVTVSDGLQPATPPAVSSPEVGPSPPPPPAPPPVQQAAPVSPPALEEVIPVLGEYQTMRSPNFTYESVFETLVSELVAFIGEGNKAKGKVLSFCATEGLGKTHILDMIHGQLAQTPYADQMFWMVARNYRCMGREQLPLILWQDWLQTAMGMGMEANPMENSRTAIQRTLELVYEGAPEETGPSPEMAAFFEDLLSLCPLEQMSLNTRRHLGRAEKHIAEMLRVLSHQKPLVMVIDDLQHADSASIDLWTRLLNGGLLASCPIYLILTHTRDFYPSGDLAQALQGIPYKEYVVSDLNEQESRHFLKSGPLYGTFERFPVSVIDQLIEKSQGLPLYMVEVLSMLQQQGILELQQIPVENTYVEKLAVSAQYANSAENIQLPASVQEVLHTRFGYLSENARFMLRNAAILGEKFTVAILQDVCGPMEEGQFQQTLKELFEQGWLHPDTVNTGRFSHGIIWQTVYELIEPEVRQQHHKLMSEYLQEALKANFSVNPCQLAYHAWHGGLLNRAFHAWNLAGVHAIQLGSITGFNVAMGRAFVLLQETGDPEIQGLQLQLQENLGVMNIEEHPEFSAQMLEYVAQRYQAAGNTPKLIEILGYVASAHESCGRFFEALEKLEQASAFVSKDQHPLEYATMLSNQLEYLFMLGKIQQALEHLEREIEPLCAQHGISRDSIYFHAFITSRRIKAQIYLMQCNSTAFDIIEEALGFAQERDLAQLSLHLQLVRTEGFLMRGQYESCRRSLQAILEQIEALEQTGQQTEALMAHWCLVSLQYHCEMGDWEQASLLVPNTLLQAEKARDYFTWMTANVYVGRIMMGTGNLQDGKVALENAINHSCEYRFATSALLGWRFLAEAELRAGQAELAEDFATRAMEIAQKPEFNHRYEFFLLANLRAECLTMLGHYAEAGKLLEPIWPQVIQTGFAPLIAKTSCQIGTLYRAMADQASDQATALKHNNRALEFLEKAKTIWGQLDNRHQLQRVEQAMR